MSRCAVARQNLAERVASLKTASAPEQIASGVKASYLASVTSAERHIGGVSLLQGFKGLVGHPADVVTDYLAHLGHPERRTNALAVTPKGVRVGVEAFGKGTREFWSAMRTGVDPETVGDAFGLQRVRLGNPILEAARSRVQTFVSARNKPFYEMALQLNLYRRAKVLAVREGLSGAKLSARVDELLAQPTDGMSVGAIQDANDATLSQAGVVDQATAAVKNKLRKLSTPEPLARADRAKAQAVREGLSGDALAERTRAILALSPATFDKLVQIPETPTPASRAVSVAAKVAYVGAELTAPFPRIAANIVGTGLDYSPVGVLKTALETVGQEKGARADYFRSGLTKATVGSSTGLAVGYYLASKGLITGDAPPSPSDRNLWELEGKKPYSVKIGGSWRSLNTFAPLSQMPVLGAALYHENLTHPGEPLRNFGAATMEHAKVLTEHSILSSLRQMGDVAADPAGKIARYLAGFVPVPPLVGQVAHGLDPAVRDLSSDSRLESAGKSIVARTPGASLRLPAKVNAFGHDVERSAGGISGILTQVFDPASSSRAHDTPLTAELDRLGVGVPKPGKSVSVDGEKRERTPAQYREFLRSVGPATEQALTAMLADPDYLKLEDADRRKAVAWVLRETHGAAENAAGRAGELGRLRVRVPRSTHR
jgi:hypothetical protein